MFAPHIGDMTNENKERHQRPEGKLLEQAMRAAPKMSGRGLADRVGLSEGRVRQIINGYKTEAGMTLEIVAPADTLARMAQELQIDADAMAAAGRPDAADLLRKDPHVGVTEEGDLWLVSTDEEIEALREWVEGDHETRPPKSVLHLWEMDDLLEVAAQKHRDEMKLLNHLIYVLRTAKKPAEGDAPTGPQREEYELIADEDVRRSIEQEQGEGQS